MLDVYTHMYTPVYLCRADVDARVRAWCVCGQIKMVLLHIKKTDELQFLFETAVANKVDDTVEELVEIWNMQIQIRRLIDSMEDLALYGVAKKPDKQCIDTYATDDWGNLINDKIERGPYYCMDPTGKRTGEAPEPRLAEIIQREISNAKKVVNAKAHVELKQTVSKLYFQECLDSLRGAVMISFPEGLPEWDDVGLILKGEWEIDGRTMEALDEGAELWFAGGNSTKSASCSSYGVFK
jgi:hypothetical protein